MAGFKQIGNIIGSTGFQAPQVSAPTVDPTQTQLSNLQNRLAATPAVDTRSPLEKLLNLPGGIGNDLMNLSFRPVQAIADTVSGATNGGFSGALQGLQNGIMGGASQQPTGSINTDPRNFVEKGLGLDPNNNVEQDVMQTLSKWSGGLANVADAGIKASPLIGLLNGKSQDQIKQDLNQANNINPVDAFKQGAAGNPDSASMWRQNFNNMYTGGNDVPYLSGIGGFGMSMIGDPTSFIPLDAPVKGIKALSALGKGAEAANAVNDAAKATQAVSDAAKSAPMDANMASLAQHEPTPNDFNLQELAQPTITKNGVVQGPINVGDHVNMTDAHGNLVNPTPVKVTNIQQDANGGKWYQTEGTNSFYPETQVQKANPVHESQGNVFDHQTGANIDSQFAKQVADVNPHAQPLADLRNEMADVKTQHDTLLNSMVKDANTALQNTSIRNTLKSANVARPVQGSAYYNEYKALDPQVQRLFQAGNTGKTNIHLDEFAHSQNMTVPKVLDALNNSRGKYTAADFANHPALQDHKNAMQMLQDLHDQVKQQHDNWLAQAQAAASKNTAADPFSLANDANFENLFNHINQRPEPNDAMVGKSAPKAMPTPVVPAGAKGSKLLQDLKNKFIKYNGLTPEEKTMFNEAENANSYAAHTIENAFINFVKSHPELSKTQWEAIGHMIEGTAQVQKWAEPVIKDFISMMDGGIKTGAGKAFGTQAELKTLWNGNPILRSLVENYFPHAYKDTATKVEEALQKSGRGFRTSGPFNNERTFETLKEAQDAGLTPYLHPAVAGANRMLQGAKSINDVTLLNRLLENGSIKKLVTKEAKTPESEQLSLFDKQMQDAGHTVDKVPAGYIRSSIPQLQGYVVRPELENALRDYLRLDDNTGAIWNALRKGSSFYKSYNIANPTVHGHNIAYNAYLAGVNGADLAKTAAGIKSGAYKGLVERAMKAGAISADNGGRFIENMAGKVSGQSNVAKKALNYAAHGALWDADKFLRATIFRKAVEGGATDAEAAARVNKFMANYNNLTPFERKYISTLIPFYAWKKANIPLQVQQWLTNTPRQMGYIHALNSVQNSINGQDSRDGKLDMGTLPDGSHVNIDPYAAGMDPIKVANDGPLGYLYASLNPFVKEAIAQATNHAYYPSPAFAPSGKGSMANVQIYKPEATAQQDAIAGIQHLANQFVPSSGVLGSALAALTGLKDGRSVVNALTGNGGNPNGPQPSPMTPGEILAKALGGFTSRVDPTKEQTSQNMDELARLQAIAKQYNNQVLQNYVNNGATPQQIADLKKNENAANGFVPTTADLKKAGTFTATKKASGTTTAKKTGMKKLSVHKPKGGSVHRQTVHKSSGHKVSTYAPKAKTVHAPKLHAVNVQKALHSLNGLQKYRNSKQAKDVKAQTTHVHVSTKVADTHTKQIHMPKDHAPKKGVFALRTRYGMQTN